MANDEQITWGDALVSEIRGEWNTPENRAFDFWIGEWEMNWRDRVDGQFRYSDEGEWTRQRVFPILGGKALVELAWDRDANADQPSGRGFSIRYFDPSRNRWVMAQNWPGPDNDGFAFLDQLIGFEDNGRLSMYSAIRRPQPDGSFQFGHRQYNFADIREGAFRWDGSNSYDEGKSWQTWNVVDAGRIRPLDDFGPAGSAWPGYLGGQLCRGEPHGAFDVLEGAWSGKVFYADGRILPVSLFAGRFLDGCGLASVMSVEGGVSVFTATAYAPKLEQWVTYTLDDQPGTRHRYYWSPTASQGAVFNEAPALAIENEFELYVLPENFDEAAARTRRIWNEMGPDDIVIEDQARSSTDENWTTAATYTFERNEGDH